MTEWNEMHDKVESEKLKSRWNESFYLRDHEILQDAIIHLRRNVCSIPQRESLESPMRRAMQRVLQRGLPMSNYVRASGSSVLMRASSPHMVDFPMLHRQRAPAPEGSHPRRQVKRGGTSPMLAFTRY